MLGFTNYGNKFLRKYVMEMLLPDGELNPDLPLDKRGPLTTILSRISMYLDYLILL